MARLGEFYAKALVGAETTLGLEVEQLFGPAYKGIPLVTTAGIAMYKEFGRDVPITFNR